FAQARGKLPWPVDGRLVARYGTPRGADARTKWDGVLIGASAGSQVRAVHGGRVVFADWLRGAGLLVILDHGNGYLSLYGHNQSLLRDAGDLVNAIGLVDVVANVDGQAKRLYPNKSYKLPQETASELARAGYVRVVVGSTGSPTAGSPAEGRETAVNPAAARRTKRGT
ncbi:MAG: murein hydrolase activator EnvC family protein, partial [Rhodanobacter sp.]